MNAEKHITDWWCKCGMRFDTKEAAEKCCIPIVDDKILKGRPQRARAVTLLLAAIELIEKSEDAQATGVYYDNADCDGSCLVDDIKILLDLPIN